MEYLNYNEITVLLQWVPHVFLHFISISIFSFVSLSISPLLYIFSLIISKNISFIDKYLSPPLVEVSPSVCGNIRCLPPMASRLASLYYRRDSDCKSKPLLWFVHLPITKYMVANSGLYAPILRPTREVYSISRKDVCFSS